ncbi:hypothetical protein NVV94_04570 [Pseudomonas sp. LS1212]|uniref:hypothetical protein n=1 Tax=Pseudomonas sp. LS1212 TaxID=2972478 RepID=UPI00215C707F|nr:hypothetical protein [Pseudomonas sp. LS1212]UVJ44865.1 hypothetical protein NVV94_04570 [Pseudomonas sp. LS1212]
MYESKNQPVLTRRQFIYRLFLHSLTACLLIGGSVALGAGGHLYFEEGVSWHDAVFNATLMLGGIGPISLPQSVAGKLFFAGYGLYAGLVFVTSIGLILAPVVHRILHRFHCDEDLD